MVWAELAEELPIGLLLKDQRGQVVASNDMAAKLLGCTREQLRTGEWPPGWRVRDEGGSALPSPTDLADQVQRTGGSLAMPVVIDTTEASPVRLWMSCHPVRRAGEPMLLVALRPVHTDVTTAYSLRDTLTGLPNRALLLDRLSQALVRARTHGTLVSLVLLDICRMSAVNAEHGFRRGDDLLVLVAGRLRDGLRADHTVARYSGDRFAVVAEHPAGTGAAVAGRIGELVNRSARLGTVRLRPAARVCWLTTDGTTPIHGLLTRLETRLAEAGPDTGQIEPA